MKRPDLNPRSFDGKISKVVEECGEVLQCIGKYQIHGIMPCDGKTGISYNNIKSLETELNDAKAAIETLLSEPLFQHITSI